MIVLTSLGISLLLRKGTAEHPIAMLMAAEQRKAVMHRLSELARKELSRLLHTHAQEIEPHNDANKGNVQHRHRLSGSAAGSGVARDPQSDSAFGR